MTTIAYRDGVLAADTRGTCSDWVLPAAEQKLLRLKDGRPAALTGGLGQAMTLFRWIDGSREGPQPTGTVRVVVLCPDNRLEVFEDGGSYFETTEFAAWGSGMPVALGALHAGATAERAVRIAMLVDPYSGGDVLAMRCGE